ncbi:MAG: cobalt transporter CbiM [bacterium]
MHIPDNYLSPSTCTVFGLAMMPVWFVALKKVKKEISAKKIPTLGVFAALSFLIMMFNIPLPGGTTGHAVGSTLIAILIGPFAACISVTIALFVQAVFFGDGGVLVFGVNCFNMAFLMPFTGYFLYRLFKVLFGDNKSSNFISVFIASYISLNIAALVAAIQFGIQPLLFNDSLGHPIYSPYPLSISIPAMMLPHLLMAGILEGLISVGVFSYLNKMESQIIYANKPNRITPVYGLLLLMILLSPLGLVASGTAWGEWGNHELEKMLGFLPVGISNGFSFKAIIPDYTIPLIQNRSLAYVISALFGVAIIIIFSKLISSNSSKTSK